MVRHKKQVKATVETVQEELNNTVQLLKDLARDKKNYFEQSDVEIEIHAMKVKDGMNKRIVPQFKVEEDDRYWELQTKLLEYKFRERAATIQGTRSKIEYEIGVAESSKADLEKQLEQLKEIRGI